MTIQQDFRKYVAQTSPSPYGLVVEKAEGSYLYGSFSGVGETRPFFDFTSGIGVNSLGARNHKATFAIVEQALDYGHTTVYGEHVQSAQVEYAKALVEKWGEGGQVFFQNSGSEANDLALKMVRKITGKKNVIALTKAFHGRGYGPMQLTWNAKYREGFGVDDSCTRWIDPFKPLFTQIEELEPDFLENLGGVFVELVQGEGGCRALPQEFVDELFTWCHKNNIMTVVDEVQTGFGRTGQFFAQDTYSVRASITTIGKAGGGGLPFGAVISSKKNFEKLQDPPLSHLTTFGGNPIVCAAGLEILKQVTPELLKNVEECSRFMTAQYRIWAEKYPNVVEGYNGRGLMLALRLKSKEAAWELFETAREENLILAIKLNNPTIVRTTIPLNTPLDDLKSAFKSLEVAIAVVEKELS